MSGFRIAEQLAENKNVVVVRATREDDSAPCILKILKNTYPTETELARMHHEFELTRSIDLPGVVKAYELCRHGRGLMIVYEDFQGTSLAKLLQERSFTVQEFLEIAPQIVVTLGQLHSAHIIHKGLSPSNLVLNLVTGHAKIIDFGISTRLPTEQQPLANPQFLEGTLAYISPEQTGRMN